MLGSPIELEAWPYLTLPAVLQAANLAAINTTKTLDGGSSLIPRNESCLAPLTQSNDDPSRFSGVFEVL